jgi:hypothetical protein
MIFVGDIAAPDNIFPAVDFRRWLEKDEFVVANLEGALADRPDEVVRQKRLFNHPSVVSYLKRSGVRVVSLANNHVFDIGSDVSDTIARLAYEGVGACGAGSSLAEAARPLLQSDNGRERLFLAFGWDAIQCPPAGMTRPGVNPLEPRHVLHSVEAARGHYPEATITLLMHWDYELELYPMPMHRELAFRSIDRGADAVIGCHSHCVQGVEVYKGAPIAYGLGNWFLAQGLFFGGKLRFPDFASLQLAFQWKPESGDMTLHWFEYDMTDHSLREKHSEPLVESRERKDLTPFSGMNHKEYARWFRKHRRKRKLLPVYQNPDARLGNRVRTEWVGARQRLIDLAFRIGLKDGPR